MSDSEETIWDPISSSGRDHAPEWLRARFLQVVFLAKEEELTAKTFATSLNITNPNTYMKFIFLRTSPLRKTRQQTHVSVPFCRCDLNYRVVHTLAVLLPTSRDRCGMELWKFRSSNCQPARRFQNEETGFSSFFFRGAHQYANTEASITISFTLQL